MKATDYYRRRVQPRRPYITDAMCEAVLADPIHTQAQKNGRIRHWAFVSELLGGRFLRVITLPDGETVHCAFPDRRFKPEEH